MDCAPCAYPVFVRGGRSTDAVALYEVFVGEEYAITKSLSASPFVIDGGANVGMASLYFLNRYPGSKVVAVEPDPANFEICRKNLAPYGDRVVLVLGAIWKSAGSLALEPGADEWVTTVRGDRQGTVEAFTVPRLMTHGNGTVDLLKLDIEGSEREVFGAGAEEWLPHVRNIAIELHGDDCKDTYFRALEGYRYDLSMHTSWTGMVNGLPASCYVALCQNLCRES